LAKTKHKNKVKEKTCEDKAQKHKINGKKKKNFFPKEKLVQATQYS
jgi:hypothetical protein